MENDIEQLQKSALRSGGWLAIIGMLGALGVWIWMTTARGLDWDDWMIATIPLVISGILVFVGWLAVVKNKKGRLPTLTRIAVGIILVSSALVIVWALVGLFMSPSEVGFVLFGLPWFFLHLPIAPAVFLTFKEKWAWGAAIALFALGMIFIFVSPSRGLGFPLHFRVFYFVIAVVPLILVIIDKKKYWEMTEALEVPPDEPAEQ